MIRLLANGHAARTLDRIKGALAQAACDAAVGRHLEHLADRTTLSLNAGKVLR